MQRWKLPIILGLAHGLNDFTAGYLLARYADSEPNWEKTSFALLVYSILAFGGQLPAGMLIDSIKNTKPFIFLSIAGIMLACGISYEDTFIAIIISGIASAFVHTSGGTAISLTYKEKTTPAGVFAAPGVVGLIFGGIIGQQAWSGFPVISVIALFLILAVFYLQIPSYPLIKYEQKEREHIFDTHDLFMVILLAAIVLRSLTWNILHMISGNDTQWLAGIAISAFLGKLAGGLLTDRLPIKKYLVSTLLICVVLLYFGRHIFPLFCLGVFVLQSAIPITLVMMQQALPAYPATATGLCLGVAIALAGLPTYLDTFSSFGFSRIFWMVLLSVFMAINLFVVWFYKTIKN